MPKLLVTNISELSGDDCEVFRHDDLDSKKLEPGQQVVIDVDHGEEVDVRMANLGFGGGRKWGWDVSVKRTRPKAGEPEESGEPESGADAPPEEGAASEES